MCASKCTCARLGACVRACVCLNIDLDLEELDVVT